VAIGEMVNVAGVALAVRLVGVVIVTPVAVASELTVYVGLVAAKDVTETTCEVSCV
jgi:hypothetical protein